MKKVTFVFTQSKLTVYPSMSMAEKDLGVHALRRTLQQHSGVAYVDGYLVVRPENEYDLDYLNGLIEAQTKGLINLFV